MSQKELARQAVLEKINRKELTMKAGAKLLEISIRQLRRSRRRYEVAGLKGLCHAGRGKPSGRALGIEMRSRIEDLLATRYPDFGATFAAEKLALDLKQSISREKVRQIQIAMGLHSPKKRKNGRYYPRRQRRSCEGDLVQSDGSVHDWLEGRGAQMTLITFIDDATSKIKMGRFVEVESTAAYMELSKMYIEQYGRPQALYVDKHSIFRQTKKEVRERGKLTSFGAALKELDIELICANSPQAKGRVERGFGTLQDRLVKEMRLAGICTLEEANAFLSGYIEEHNKKFGVPAATVKDAHRKLCPKVDLNWVFSWKEERRLSKNLTFQYAGVLYQVEAPDLVNRLRSQKVLVRRSSKGEMQVSSSWGKLLKFRAYEEVEAPVQRTLDSKELNRLWVDRNRKPSKHHPWR